MVDTNMEVLQRYAQDNFGLDLNGALRIQTGIDLDVNGIAQELYGVDANAAFADLKGDIGGNALILPGTNGSYVQTTDKAALDIVGDIDIRAEIAEQTATGLNRDIISKYTPTTQQSFEWRLNAFGLEDLVWSTTGANALVDSAGIWGGSEVAIRLNMDVDDGAGNRILTWYRSDNGRLEGTWIERLQEIVPGTTSIFASTAVVRIGARGDAAGANAFQGRITRLELRNSVGTVVANPDFRFLPAGSTTPFVDAAGNTWTFVGDAVIG